MLTNYACFSAFMHKAQNDVEEQQYPLSGLLTNALKWQFHVIQEMKLVLRTFPPLQAEKPWGQVCIFFEISKHTCSLDQ